MKPAAHQYEDKLLEFAYRELPAHEADAVEAHVRGCPRCAEALAQLRSVRVTMNQLPLEAAPEAGLESLLAYADQQAAKNRAAQPARWWKVLSTRRVTALGSAAALLVVTIVAWQASHLSRLPDVGLMAAQKESAREAKTVAVPPTAAATAPQPAEAEAPAEATVETLSQDSVQVGRVAKEKRRGAPAPRKELQPEDPGVASDYSNAIARGTGLEAKQTVDGKAASYKKSKKGSRADEEHAPMGAASASVPTPEPSYGLGSNERQGAQPVAKSAPASAPAPAQVAAAAEPKASSAGGAASLGLRGLGKAGVEEEGSAEDARRGADKADAPDARQQFLNSARAAGQRGDQQGEVRFALQAVQAGVTDSDRLDMLQRLCAGYEALGDAAAADRFCDALLREFPRSEVAEAVARKRSYQQVPAAPTKRAAPSPKPTSKVKSESGSQRLDAQ